MNRLWDAQTDEIHAITVSPTDATIAVATHERSEVVLLNPADGARSVGLSHGDPILAVAWSADGAWLASSSTNHLAIVWSGRTYRVFNTFTHADWVWSVALSPDGATLFTGGGEQDGMVRRWDVATGQMVGELRETGRARTHDGEVTALALTPDGATIISVGGHRLIVWDARTGGPRWHVEPHAQTINTLAIEPDGDLLIGGTASGLVKLWAVANGAGIDHRQLDAPVMAVAAHPNGRHIAAALADGSVALLTMGTHQELRIAGVWPLGGDALRGCAWLPDGRLVCGDKAGRVSCWDVTA